MSNDNKLLTFMFGAALGVGAGLYLNSKNGKQLRKKAMNKVSDVESTIEDKVNEAYEKLKNQVNNAASKVKEATDK
jgi:gas vesicle protein